jgi:hypothetical protein
MVLWRRAVCVLVLGFGVGAGGTPASGQEGGPTEQQIEKMSLQDLMQTPIDVWTATKTVEPRT